MDSLDFANLLQVHKLEAAEGMAMITAFAAIVIGILGYLGAVRQINLVARVAIAIGFTVIAAADLKAIVASNKMHEAIHIEIRERLEKNSELVMSEMLRNQLKEQHLPSERTFIITHVFFDLLMIAAILLIGEGNIRNAWKQRKQASKHKRKSTHTTNS